MVQNKGILIHSFLFYSFCIIITINKEKENERLVPKVQSALLGSNKLLKAGMKVYNINYGAGRNTFKVHNNHSK